MSQVNSDIKPEDIKPEGYYGHQPVVQQPPMMSSTNTTVVIQQQQHQQRHRQRGWTSGMCGCFDDCGICCCVLFCMPCAECQLAQDLGEFCCLPYCVPNWFTAVRTKVRTQLDIHGSICDDYCMALCCYPCTLCQVKREVKIARQNGEL